MRSPSDIYRDRYKESLALPDQAIDAESPEVRALARAHALRQFEIENYWKRATYVWAFQVASFTLLGLMLSGVAKQDLRPDSLLVPTGLGALSGLNGLLTALGSKFWQENWEYHVDMLETAVEGRLTQTILFKNFPAWSVSRLNIMFLLYITVGWIVAFVVTLHPELETWWYSSIDSRYRQLADAVLLGGALLGLLLGTRTRLSGRAAAADRTWHPLPDLSWYSSGVIVRRKDASGDESLTT